MTQEEPMDVLMKFKHIDDYRVLFALVKHLSYENQIAVSQTEISRMLSMSSAQVSRAIKRLLEAKIIFKDNKKGINWLYRLSPELGWKGSGKNHIRAIRENKEQQRKAENTESPTQPTPY